MTSVKVLQSAKARKKAKLKPPNKFCSVVLAGAQGLEP